MSRTIAVAASFVAALAWAGERFTQEQLNARFYYDLGPAEVDISSYPKAQQENYLQFKKTCAQCHTLARPINAPITKRGDWQRYVQRMHLYSKSWKGAKIAKGQARAVVDFLTFDSTERKVKNKGAFQAKAEELQALFQEVQQERLRLKAEKDQKKVRTTPPYTGVK